MKVVPEVAPEAAGEPVLFGQVVGQPEPSPVEEPPAPVLGVVVGEGMEAAPRGQEMERAYDGTDLGSIESLGRWNVSKEGDRAMPIKLKAVTAAVTCLFSNNEVRAGFGNFFDKLVDELVQQGASSGILAINNWKATRGRKKHRYTVVVYGFS